MVQDTKLFIIVDIYAHIHKFAVSLNQGFNKKYKSVEMTAGVVCS